MTDLNDWASFQARLQTQHPLTIGRGLPVGRASGVIAQVDCVLLFSAGVTFDISLNVSAGRLRQVDVSSIEMSQSLWVDTPDVHINASVDGSPLQTFHANEDWSNGPGLHATGGEWQWGASGAYAKSPWWINTIPARELLLQLEWPHLSFTGQITLYTSDWRRQARNLT